MYGDDQHGRSIQRPRFQLAKSTGVGSVAFIFVTGPAVCVFLCPLRVVVCGVGLSYRNNPRKLL